MCVLPAFHCSVTVCLLLYVALQLSETKKSCGEPTHASPVCVCADRRPPGPGSCLPHGGRGRRLQCPANSHHARHRLPLLLFQLPLRPQQVATTTQTGVCRSHESQGCSSADEGVCSSFVYTEDFSLVIRYFVLCKICASNSSLQLQSSCQPLKLRFYLLFLHNVNAHWNRL